MEGIFPPSEIDFSHSPTSLTPHFKNSGEWEPSFEGGMDSVGACGEVLLGFDVSDPGALQEF